MKVFGILVFCLACIFLNRKLYKKIVCFPSVLTVIWCVSLALSTLGLYDTYPVPDEVIWYALIFIFSINFFSAVFSKFCRKENKKISKKEYLVSNKVLTVILAGCSVALLIILKESIGILFSTHSFSAVRNAYINYESIDMHAQVLLTVTIVPLARAACVFSIIDLIYNRKLKSSFIMSVLFIIIYAIMTGGRSMIVLFLLMIAIALYDKERSLKRIWKNNKGILRFGLAAVAILAFVTLQRGFSGDKDILQSVYVYFVGCFNLFGVYLSSPEIFFGPLLWGQALISGFSFPFIEAMRFMGADILPGNYILAEQATSKYIAISPKVAINATPTTMYPAMRDFGVAGLMIYPMVICYAFQKIKNRVSVGNTVLAKGVYINFLASALLLSMAFQFGTFQNIVGFLYLWVIYRISKWVLRSEGSKVKNGN